MLSLIKDYFAPPTFDHPEKMRLGRMAYWLFIAMLIISILIVVFFLLLVPAIAYRAWLVMPLIFILLGNLYLLHRGAIRFASVLFLLSLWATLTVSAATGGGLLAPPFHLYVAVVFTAGLLLGWRAAVGFIALVFLTALGLYYAQVNNLLPSILTEGLLLRTWIIFDAAVAIVAVLCALALSDASKAFSKARQELAHRSRAEQSLQTANAELVQAYDTTIEGWASMIALRDTEIQDHSHRVADLTVQLAKCMGVKEDALVHLRRGALLHDIGKIGIPDAILHKRGPLTEQEWVEMRRHPEYADRVLSTIEYLHPARDIPYCHHEKWDGSGYPRGLKGADIPLGARIFAVIDVWDALSSDRSYRKKWAPEQVLEYLNATRGKHFDPDVVDAFVKLIATENRDTV